MLVTDKNILDALRQDNQKESGFKMLMNTYQRQLYQQIFSLVKNHDDTKDILQNTLIKVWKHIDGFNGNSKLSTWLYSIARNESLSFLSSKHQKNNVKLSEEGQKILFGTLTADQYLNEENISLKLEKAIETLPPLQKEVFMLRYFNEMKYAKMATLLDSSESTLKSSYHFAVKKIEEMLKDD